MKSFFIGWLILFLIPVLSFSQEVDSTELIKFVKIYFEEKTIETTDSEELDSLFRAYNIDDVSYKDLWIKINQGSEPNDSMQDLKKELEELIFIGEMRKEEIVRNKCIERNLDYNNYQKIKQKYRKELSFQRLLQPYFQDYFKALKDE